MVAYRGVYYFPTRADAFAYAVAQGAPTDRIIEYGRGFAIQLRASGPYLGPSR